MTDGKVVGADDQEKKEWDAVIIGDVFSLQFAGNKAATTIQIKIADLRKLVNDNPNLTILENREEGMVICLKIADVLALIDNR